MKIVTVLYPGGESAKKHPELLGCVENCLGLREAFEKHGHTVVALTDSQGELDKHLPDADILVPTPFWPMYMDRDRLNRAEKLRLIVTAGVGSDHIDLKAAAEKGVTVAEITGSNVVSVAEHVVMQILALVRNYMPAYQEVLKGGWNIGELAVKSHDLENKSVGIIGLGRIGQRVASRLKPFDVHLSYYDNIRIPTEQERELSVEYCSLEQLVESCDIVSINCPLTPATERMFNKDLLLRMKKGAYLVNTARGGIVDTEALVEVMESGHLAGYAGDVWYPQPAPANHPWRYMPNHALTPHISGTTIEAQKRYADGVIDCIQRFFTNQPIHPEFLIVDGGRVMSPSYSYAYEQEEPAALV
jgi:formate dehydrogenase